MYECEEVSKPTLLHQSKRCVSLLPVMRACWTSSCRCRLTKIALTLPAYRGPSGAGSSSLVCLRVPWYTWGSIGCVKFSLRVWVYLSCWYCECYTVWWGCLFISGLWQRVCAHVKSLGCVLRKASMDYYWFPAPFPDLWVRYCYRWFFCTSRLRTVTLPSWRERGVTDITPCPYLVVVILHRRIDRTYKWHLRWKEACAIAFRIIEGTHYWSNLSSTHSNYIYTTSWLTKSYIDLE